MSAVLPFAPAHVSAVAARAAELERLGEELQDPNTLVRAARLYTLAVRIADDIDLREALPFMQSDLARVRDELRTLATDAVTAAVSGEQSAEAEGGADPAGEITRMFREIAHRIEQRLAEASG